VILAALDFQTLSDAVGPGAPYALLAVGIGALKLLHRDVAQTVTHWVDILRVDPDNHLIHGLLTRVLSVTTGQLRAASVGTFFYAGLLLTEGMGLLYRKR